MKWIKKKMNTMIIKWSFIKLAFQPTNIAIEDVLYMAACLRESYANDGKEHIYDTMVMNAGFRHLQEQIDNLQ